MLSKFSTPTASAAPAPVSATFADGSLLCDVSLPVEEANTCAEAVEDALTPGNSELSAELKAELELELEVEVDGV